MEYTGPTTIGLLGLWLVIHSSAAAELSSIANSSLPAEPVPSSQEANNSMHHQVEFISQYLLNVTRSFNHSTDNKLNIDNATLIHLKTNRENNTTSNNIQLIPVPAAVSSVIDTLPVHPRIPRKSPVRRKTRRRLNKYRSIPGQPVRFLLPPLENEVLPEITSTTTEPATSSETVVIITSPSPGHKTSTTTEAVSGRFVVESEEKDPDPSLQTSSPQYRKVFIPPPLRYLLPPFFYENYINAQPSTTLSPPLADVTSVKPFLSSFDGDDKSENLQISANFSNHNSDVTSSIAPTIISENNFEGNWNHQNSVKLESSSPALTDNAFSVSYKETEAANSPSADSYPVQSTTAEVLGFSQSTSTPQYGEYVSRPVKHFSSKVTLPNHSNQPDLSSTLAPENSSINYHSQFQSSVESHYNYPTRLQISILSSTLSSALDAYPNQNNKTSLENYPTISTISITSSTLFPPHHSLQKNGFNDSFENFSNISLSLNPSSTVSPPLHHYKTHNSPSIENYSTIPIPSSTLNPPLDHYKTHENRSFENYPTIPVPSSTLSPPLHHYKTHDNPSIENYSTIPIPSSTLNPPLDHYKTHENRSFENYPTIPVPSSTLSPPLHHYKTHDNPSIENYSTIPIPNTIPSSTLNPPLDHYKTHENQSFENYPSMPIHSSTLSSPLNQYKTQESPSFENHPSVPVHSSILSPMDYYKTHGNTTVEKYQKLSNPSSSLRPPLNSYVSNQNLSQENYPRIPVPSTTLTPPTHSFPILRGPNIEQALFETGKFSFDLPMNDSMESTMSMMNRPLLSPEVAEAGMKIMANMKMDEVKKVKLNRGKSKYNHLNQFNFQNGLEDSSRLKVSPNSKSSQLAVAETSYYDGRKYKQNIEEADIKAIPGRPGKDYPTLSKPPDDSDFSCRSVGYHRGYVADHVTGCQVFYICVGNGPGEPMLCPNGTVFSQDFLVCDWWFNVDCKQQT